MSGDDIYTLIIQHPKPCGLLRIELAFSYPIYSAFGRPEGVHLTVLEDARSVIATDIVPMTTDDSFNVYVFLSDAYQMKSLFDGNYDIPNVDWNRIHIEYEDTGLFGVSPSDFSISEVACVRIQDAR
jgi:hypothetical protein